MANINELLKRRFLYTTEAKWNSVTDKSQYDNSIVFIKSSTEGIGYAIYTQGHTFYTDDVTAVNLLAKLKEGDNISLMPVKVKEIVDGKEVEVEKVQITATDTTYTLSTEEITNGAKLTFNGSVKGEDGKSKSVNEFSIVGSGDAKVTVEGSTVTIDAAEYTGENAISVVANDKSEGDKVVKLVIDSDDKVLSQGTGGLKTTLTLNYDSASNKVQLLGNTVGEGEKATNIISEFDASAFVKDSFLVNAELVGEKPAETEGGQPIKGQYLKFTFNVIEQDDQSLVSTKEVYIEASTFFHETEGDSVTYSVVEFNSEKGAYTVKNTLGTISRDNANNKITVDKAGLATVGDIKTVLETINSNLDAVKADGADANEIAVVTGVTQVDGKITAVDSGLAATKTYVDNKVSGAEGELSLTNSTNGYEFAAVEDKDGYVKASEVAAILNAAWEWGEI